MLETQLGGRYKVIKVLGAGGFGQTYVAQDTQRPAHPRCVVKHLKPASQDPKFLQVARRLFKTEAETLEKLGQHKQIPQLLAYFEENHEFYLVQELVEGHPLSDELSSGTRLTESEVTSLLKDVLSILEFVHSCQVVHRDIKPSNLLRRVQDDKLVLIDFGAVKKIQARSASESDKSDLTVGIGTQGYMPSEQLAGKPRFNSDLYALGITAIQALTGLRPSQLSEDSETSEINWQEQAQVSKGLALILTKMVKYHFRERYQSATEVLQALEQLTQPSLELVPKQLAEHLPTNIGKLTIRSSIATVMVGIAVTGVLLLRQMGGLQPLELAVFDQLMRQRPDQGPDPRLLVVAITEEDIQANKHWPISDQVLAQLLAKLQSYQPKVIGLNLYRDLPQAPGHQQLLAELQNLNVITVTKIVDADGTEVPPPPGVPKERVGFSDLVLDPDDIIRRNLMLVGTQKGIFYSFSLRVSLAYLERLPEFVLAEGIEPKNSTVNPNYLQLGQALFVPLKANSGGYQTIDPGGYQLLLQYRSPRNIARQVTLSDVLNGKVDPTLVKDRIVLISTTAPSRIDRFYTPYTSSKQQNPQVSGINIQAQMVSQILSAALDKQPLFWFWSEDAEIAWIVGWGLAGVVLGWKVRHPLLLILGSSVMLGVLFGTVFLLFTQQGWIPLIAPALCFMVTGASGATYQLMQKGQKHTKVSPENPQLTQPTTLEDTQSTHLTTSELTPTKTMPRGQAENLQLSDLAVVEDALITKSISCESNPTTKSVCDHLGAIPAVTPPQDS